MKLKNLPMTTNGTEYSNQLNRFITLITRTEKIKECCEKHHLK